MIYHYAFDIIWFLDTKCKDHEALCATDNYLKNDMNIISQIMHSLTPPPQKKKKKIIIIIIIIMNKEWTLFPDFNKKIMS